jgi:hypothetical protein
VRVHRQRRQSGHSPGSDNTTEPDHVLIPSLNPTDQDRKIEITIRCSPQALCLDSSILDIFASLTSTVISTVQFSGNQSVFTRLSVMTLNDPSHSLYCPTMLKLRPRWISSQVRHRDRRHQRGYAVVSNKNNAHVAKSTLFVKKYGAAL